MRLSEFYDTVITMYREDHADQLVGRDWPAGWFVMVNDEVKMRIHSESSAPARFVAEEKHIYCADLRTTKVLAEMKQWAAQNAKGRYYICLGWGFWFEWELPEDAAKFRLMYG